MIIPIVILYSPANLKALDSDSEKVLKALSGVHNCSFYYHPEYQKHKRIRISIENLSWGIVVGYGKDDISFTNPWFRKEYDMEATIESEAIIQECNIIFWSYRENAVNAFIENNVTPLLAHSKDFITKCKKINKPVVPVHKDEEKEIWTAYCDGLNALNKEKRDFIGISKVYSPISYNDTRLGEIYTLRLDLKRKSLDSIPEFVEKEIRGKFSFAAAEFNDEKSNFVVRFKHIEKFAEGDLDSINGYLAEFGFAPSKPHIQNLLKASVSFTPIEERDDLLSSFEEALSTKHISYTNTEDLVYYLDDDSKRDLFLEVAKEVLKDSVLIHEVGTRILKHNLSGNSYTTVAEKIEGINNVSISKNHITLYYSDSISYNGLKESVKEIFRQNGSQISIPEYKLGFRLLNMDTEGRKKHIQEVFEQMKAVRSIATTVEFDQEQARVIRFVFAIKSAEDREHIIHTLEEEIQSIGSMFKLTIKDRLGFTQLQYTLDARTINEIDENYTLNYQGEEIKLVDGKVYNSLFSDVDDPDNIIDTDKRNNYNRFIDESPVIGLCHKLTNDNVIVRLDEDFFNGERMSQPIRENDMIFFPSVGSSTELRRQSDAILRINKPGTKLQNGRIVSPPVNKRLSDFLFSPLFARGINGNINEMKENIRINKLEEELNEKQIEAVAKAVLAEDIAFIQGPPGTGKTTVIAEIIWQEIRKNPKCKILLTSQTNLAVDNALERLKYQKSIRPLRVISEQRFDRDDILYNINVLDNWVDNHNELTKGNVVDLWINSILSKIDNSGKYSRELSEWKTMLSEKSRSTRQFFVDLYKENVNLIAATCSLCGSFLFKQMFNKMFNTEDVAFDIVIMDEASKATPLEMAIPMVLGKKIIVIGDHKQLPPLMDENGIDTALRKIGRADLAKRIEDLKESQFKKLFLMSQKFNPTLVTTLDTQYRMHKDIMMTINQFYEDELGSEGLKCGIEKVMNDKNMRLRGSRYHGISCEPFISKDTHAIWVNVDGLESKENTSYKNLAEIKAVNTIMRLLSKADGFKEYMQSKTKMEDKEIGHITFYSAQKRELRKLVENGELDRGLDYRIDVVDRFQGMERNIVIVSTVRSNKYNGVGFAKEIERINVAFSRARTLLIVVGNRDLFSVNSNYKKSIGAMESINIKQLEDMLKYER